MTTTDTSTHGARRAAVGGSGALLRVEHLRKTYRLGKARVPVLRGVSMDVARGEWVAVLGASGSGKSTLLHLVGGLDRPDQTPPGEPASRIEFDGRELGRLSRRELDRYRSARVGFVFQFYHLLPELSVVDNVLIGSMIRNGWRGFAGARGEARGRAKELLEAFGLGHRLGHRPAELSGGERQRVAIARALINRPDLLLADEPTGNLDQATGSTIIDAIEDLRERFGLTIVMVTHDDDVASRADRIVRLVDGRVEGS